MLPQYLPPVLKCWVKPPFYFLLLMAFLGAALVSFGFLLFQVFAPRGDRRSYHPFKLPRLAILQTLLSGHLLGIHLHSALQKHGKVMKELKENAERGEKQTHFIPGALIPALDLGTDFPPWAVTHI